MKIIFATGNRNKMREIREILSDLSDEIISMKEAGLDPEIIEDGDSFEANALIKARAVWNAQKDRTGEGCLVLADDSGLEIDALGGAPGIYSARFMGEETPYSVKCAAFLEKLEGVPDEKRTARFRCAIAAILPDGQELVADGSVEGLIAHESAGENGFGYDPIVYYPPRGCTLAQLSEDEKNAGSHRGNALRNMRNILAEKTSLFK